MRIFASSCLVIIFFLISMLHFYWVLGGKWALSGAIPDVMKDSPKANPSGTGFKIATLVVALGLLAFSYLFYLRASFEASPTFNTKLIYGTYIIIAIFSIRAIGEFNYVGFFKKVKEGEFARNDSKYYSPLCLLIAILATMSLF